MSVADVLRTSLPPQVGPQPTKFTKHLFLFLCTLAVEKEYARCMEGSLFGQLARRVELHVIQLIGREFIVVQAPTHNFVNVVSPMHLCPLASGRGCGVAVGILRASFTCGRCCGSRCLRSCPLRFNVARCFCSSGRS